MTVLIGLSVAGRAMGGVIHQPFYKYSENKVSLYTNRWRLTIHFQSKGWWFEANNELCSLLDGELPISSTEESPRLLHEGSKQGTTAVLHKERNSRKRLKICSGPNVFFRGLIFNFFSSVHFFS